jgi:3-phenylpropionate/trans-cinnamate dioxygenase ferredoxin reductase subunit
LSQPHYDVLIVGAGHGGAQTAIALRQLNFAGRIAILGDEPHPPYQRPPLSKEYLTGEQDFERMLIRPLSFWSERGISLLLGRRAIAVDPEAHLLTLEDGATLSYGRLVWAAGGKPYRLACPGHDLARIHYVRSRSDVNALTAELPQVERVAVVGGGYIGLEAAAGLRKLGKEVVVLEAADRVLGRVAGEPISRFYESEHRAQGVDLRTNATVRSILGDTGARGVRLASGEELAAQMVVVGIGIAAAAEPLVAAGAAGGNGVHVDEHCRTSLPDIFAVGDCAAQENRLAGGARVRLESVQNATDQGTTAAKMIADVPEPYSAIPWFWSNQYDLRLQTVGISTGYDELIVRGSPDDRSFSVVYLRQGKVAALDCVNATKDYVQGRKLVAESARVPREQLADPSLPLKEVARA